MKKLMLFDILPVMCVIRAVKDNLKRSANPIKKELILCLDDMIELEGIAVLVLHLSHV